MALKFNDPLADQIDRAVDHLTRLMREASQEFTREDLPEAMFDDADEADERAQELASDVDCDERLPVILEMLRRIDMHDAATDASEARV